jgi:hypothetical protein
MPSSRVLRVPSYRRRKPTGQAVVTHNGKNHYLGRWNTSMGLLIKQVPSPRGWLSLWHIAYLTAAVRILNNPVKKLLIS